MKNLETIKSEINNTVMDYYYNYESKDPRPLRQRIISNLPNEWKLLDAGVGEQDSFGPVTFVVKLQSPSGDCIKWII